MSKGLLSPESDAPIDSVCPVNWLHPLNRGRIAWWLGLPGHGSGSRMSNIVSGRSEHATLINAPIWFGMLNGFSGVSCSSTASQYLSAPNPAGWAPGTTGEFTIAIWARLISTANVNAFLMSNETGALQTGVDLVHGIGSVSGRVSFRIAGAGEVGFSGGYNDGVWRRYLGCRRSGTGFLYVNGKQVASAASGGDATASNTTFQIGARNGASFPGGPSQFGDGSIWSRALSDSEIDQDYVISVRHYHGLLRRLNVSVPRRYAPTSSGGLLMRRRRAVA